MQVSFMSTRGGATCSAAGAIAQGLSGNGGLFAPLSFPQISLETIGRMGTMDYAQRAAVVLTPLLSGYDAQWLAQTLQAVYGGGAFGQLGPAPLKKLEPGTYVLELFHGPTMAFKDLALQLLPRLLPEAMRICGDQRQVLVLTATSGDTGKAALAGFADQPGVHIAVYYPKDGVSDAQQAQMLTQTGENTWVASVAGNFDDAQSGVKAIFSDRELAARLDGMGVVLSSANSINFGRLAPQIVYYFSAYSDLVSQGAVRLGEAVDFVVPTGNFGNILAGYYAKRMGLPVGRLTCASNANRVLTDFFTQGRYDTHRPFYKTASPSMDILISSNLERLLFEMAGRDCDQVSAWMAALAGQGAYTVPEDTLARMGACFEAGCADDAQTAQTIAQVWRERGYVLDPHTAVGCRVMRQREPERVRVLLSTASPYKFCADVLHALGEQPRGDFLDQAEALHRLTGLAIPRPLAQLKGLPVRYFNDCTRQNMADKLMDWITARV